jgi:ATP-dependent exoDNAse (exonuclease V) alpha subunit
MNPLIQDAVNPIVHDYTKQQYEQLAKSNSFLAQFRAGDKVYHTMNWYGPNLPELMNGLSGVVSGLDFEEQSLTVLYDGKLVEYTKEMMEEHPHCITLAYCGTGKMFNPLLHMSLVVIFRT